MRSKTYSIRVAVICAGCYLYRRDTELAMLQRPAEIWKVLIIKAPRNLNVSTCGGNIMETHNTRLAAISPEPECGKSRVLEISEVLVPRPVESVSVTPAYLF